MTPLAKITLAENPRIVVCRTDALGDVILATPVFRELKRRFPESHLTALCRDYTAPVLRHNPSVDKIISFADETIDPGSVIERLRQGKYDLALALFPSKFCATILRAAEIPLRLGSLGRFHSWKFTHRVFSSRRSNLQSEAACNLDLLKPLGIVSADLQPEVFVSGEEIKQMRTLLADLDLKGDLVALHPGSGGSAMEWSLSCFMELARQMEDAGLTPIFTGSSSEAEEIIAAAKMLGGTLSSRALSLVGKTDLRQLAALLSQVKLLVANSTGPLHLAAAVGTATVALFPPAKGMAPARWAPPVDNCSVITPNRPSCRCVKSCQLGDCMDQISVSDVFSVVCSGLARDSADS